MKSFLFKSLLTFHVIACSFNAISADSTPSSATEYLKQKHQSMYALVKKKTGEDSLKQAISELLDFHELSKQALGRHWKKRSEAEREQFTSLLTQLVERNYKNNLDKTLDYKIRYLKEEKTSEGTALVKTKAKSKKNKRSPAVSIDYDMLQSNDTWKVFDVITDGASMIRSYRSQFNRILKKEGWAGLIEKMNSKLASKDS